MKRNIKIRAAFLPLILAALFGGRANAGSHAVASPSLSNAVARSVVAQSGLAEATAPAAFRLDGLDFLPIGSKEIDGEWWYVQQVRYPDGQIKVIPVAPTADMYGLEVRTGLANDGDTPMTYYMQTIRPSDKNGVHDQWMMIGAFTTRLAQIIDSQRAMALGVRAFNARATASSAKVKPAGGSGSADDPEPANKLVDGIPEVEVPGERPPPYYPPPYDDPPPLPPDAPPPPDGGGGGGGGGAEGDTASLASDGNAPKVCGLIPTPFGVPMGACITTVRVDGKLPRDPLDPDAAPLPKMPPANWDWCSLVGCTSPLPPMPQPPDPNAALACDLKYWTDLSVCWKDYILGNSDGKKRAACVASAKFDVQECHVKVGGLRAANTSR